MEAISIRNNIRSNRVNHWISCCEFVMELAGIQNYFPCFRVFVDECLECVVVPWTPEPIHLLSTTTSAERPTASLMRRVFSTYFIKLISCRPLAGFPMIMILQSNVQSLSTKTCWIPAIRRLELMWVTLERKLFFLSVLFADCTHYFALLYVFSLIRRFDPHFFISNNWCKTNNCVFD